MFRWEAMLDTGVTARQGEVPYLDLFAKRMPIRVFRIVDPEDGEVLVRVHLLPDDRVIYRRRGYQKVRTGSGNNVELPGLWIVFHQRKVGPLVMHVASVVEETTKRVWHTRVFHEPIDFPLLYDCEVEAGVVTPTEVP